MSAGFGRILGGFSRALTSSSISQHTHRMIQLTKLSKDTLGRSLHITDTASDDMTLAALKCALDLISRVRTDPFHQLSSTQVSESNESASDWDLL